MTTTRRRALAALGSIGLAAGLVVAAPVAAQAATTTTTTQATGCTTGSVPTQFQGRPSTLKAGQPAGYWIWHDKAGWHVAATHATKERQVFSGVVRSSGTMHATGVKLEHGVNGDSWVIGPKRHTLTFRFTNFGGNDELRIGADCSATMSFTLYADGTKVDPSQIHLGSAAAAATANPVVMTRIPAA